MLSSISPFTRNTIPATKNDKNKVFRENVARNQNPEEIKAFLLSAEPEDINSCGESGNTALHYACERGHLEHIRNLINAKADIINTVNRNNKRPLDLLPANSPLQSFRETIVDSNSAYLQLIAKLNSSALIRDKIKYKDYYTKMLTKVDNLPLNLAKELDVIKNILLSEVNVLDENSKSKLKEEFNLLVRNYKLLHMYYAMINYSVKSKVLIASCGLLSTILYFNLKYNLQIDCNIKNLGYKKDDVKNHQFLILYPKNEKLGSHIVTDNGLLIDILYHRYLFLSGDKEIIINSCIRLPDILNPIKRFDELIDGSVNFEMSDDFKIKLPISSNLLSKKYDSLVENVISDVKDILDTNSSYLVITDLSIQAC